MWKEDIKNLLITIEEQNIRVKEQENYTKPSAKKKNTQPKKTKISKK